MTRRQACSGDGCDGFGWVEDAEVDGSHFVRPCAVCRPELFQRWRSRKLDAEVEGGAKLRKPKADAPAAKLPLAEPAAAAEQQRTLDESRADLR